MDATTTDDTPDRTRQEWYELAQEHDIEGRSSMTKDELAAAVVSARAPETGQWRAFARFAERRAAGEVTSDPLLLRGHARRLHVRRTIREDHEGRIMDNADDARTKFDTMADDRFAFFRGTALLFYRDIAGLDARSPLVFALGDVHPENFGVMPSRDNVPMFGVNDFDESHVAPFTWDLRRGAVGFWIGAQDIGGLSDKKVVRTVRHFVKGYLRGIAEFAIDDRERDLQMRRDNSPKLVVELIDDATTSREEWLADDYHDEFGRGFQPTDEIIPVSSRIEEFQAIVDRWIERNAIEVPARAGDMRVKDVAIRRGAGTASLGLDRFYVLIEGERADATDDILLEFKRARRSALSGLTPGTDLDPGEGRRIARAQRVQLMRADTFYGDVEIDGRSFMSRERAPYRDDIDLDDLSPKQWRKYAAICGRALAQAHALSDEHPERPGDIAAGVERRILDAVDPTDLFVADLLASTEEAVTRLDEDHRHFCADHELDAFSRVDVDLTA